MTSYAEREVMGLILTTNAEMVSRVLRGESGAESPGVSAENPEVLAAVAATRSLDLIVDDILHALVRQARTEGHTWAEIGDLLHVTRQAAFQRFGSRLVDKADGEESMKPLVGAEQRAVEVLNHWVTGRWEDIRTAFDERMTQGLSVGMLESARVEIEEALRRFQELGTPAVTMRGAYTVVDVPMAFEKGDLKGRVVFNVDAQIAGFFVLNPE